ncbi:LytR/AlgR family response regulator transcription factor [Olivibacter sitiensis]|uniref:LytR/AlgR family response regulator transcription factor n=1 Tax=Olivibacter sitiensis TaxID=376470 RepID=UPI0003F5A414|nr:LytTR family DNA-binding domain-containing protein [Olivibacter sitiensis]
MSRKSILIVDDEENARQLIKEYLKEQKDFFIAGECHNGIEAIKYINMLEPDVVFLDIQMPGANGFEVLQRIDHVPQIVFTTAYDNFAVKAFEMNAVDYLLKPYTKERFGNALEKMKIQSPSKSLQFLANSLMNCSGIYPSRILVEEGRRLKNINVGDVIYIKADRDYTELHTDSKYYLSSFGIGAIVSKLDPKDFLRVHRSYIVNINHVKELYRDISKMFLVMNNGTEINVGRNFMQEVKRLMF